MINLPLYIFGIIIFVFTDVLARPVSYPGGITFMLMNNVLTNSFHAHYSPTAKTSLGYKFEYMRENKYSLNAFQINQLIKRWNNPNSQANLYLKTALGTVYSDRKNFDGKFNFGGFIGMSADWEDQRYFLSYQSRFNEAGEIDRFFQQSFNLGVTPYIGNYGDLHTWLMLKIDHIPESRNNINVTPHFRFFKDVHFFEIGSNLKKKLMINYIYRY